MSHFLTILHIEKGIPGAVTLNLYSRAQPSMLTSIVSFLPLPRDVISCDNIDNFKEHLNHTNL